MAIYSNTGMKIAFHTHRSDEQEMKLQDLEQGLFYLFHQFHWTWFLDLIESKIYRIGVIGKTTLALAIYVFALCRDLPFSI
jgi:hypothetical protein